MARHTFKVVASPHGAHTSVEMDGQPLLGCRAIRIDTSVDSATNVTLELVGCEVEFEGEADTLVETTSFGDETKTYRSPGLVPTHVLGSQIVEALRAYERRTGPLPI